MDNETIYKVVIAGEKHVGKSSLVHRFLHNKFPIRGLYSTIMVDFNIKTVVLGDHEIKLAIYDFGGEALYHEKFPKYAKGSDGLILAFDPSKESTFYILPKWIQVYDPNKDNSVAFLISTKADLGYKMDKRVIDSFITTYNFQEYFPTSAVTGKNVETVFKRMAEEIVRKKKKSRINSRKDY